MKQINVYFMAVTKVSKATLPIEDDVNVEELLKGWLKQGYCKAHLSSNRIYVFIPWANVVYIQYDD